MKLTQTELWPQQATNDRKPDLPFLEDLQAQNPAFPLVPATAKLQAWINESKRYWNARLECASFDYLRVAQVRQTWLELLIEAHDLEEAPITLLGQAAAMHNCKPKPYLRSFV